MNNPIESKRGQSKIEHEGFLYVFQTFNADRDVKFWRCEFFGSKDINCKGRVHTDLQGNFLKAVGEHTCPAGAENIGVKRVVTALKRRAVDTMETPAVLRANILQNVPTPIMAQLPDKAASKKIVKRARGIEPAPAQPLDIAQLQIPHNYQVYTRTEGQEEQLLLADSSTYVLDGRQQRILIFARASYSTWAHQMNELFVDGTFSLAPAVFYQVYAILARRRNWVFPVCYALLTDKSQSTYERMWGLIRNAWPDFQPQSISLDFEMGSINAVRAIFPQCELRGCLFHLVQNLKKKLAQCNLTQRYRADANFAVQSRMITSITFLPIGDITPAILALEAHLPPELEPVLDWFVNNYTGQIRQDGTRNPAMFPPELWSVHQRTVTGNDRTNNFAEASHRTLQRAFSCIHPTIWKFIDTLKREQKARDADMAKCIMGQEPPKKAVRYRQADARILNLVREYQPVNQGNPNQVNPAQLYPAQPIIDFLEGIAGNYHMDQ